MPDQRIDPIQMSDQPQLTTQQQASLDTFMNRVTESDGDVFTLEEATSMWVEFENSPGVDEWYADRFPHLAETTDDGAHPVDGLVDEEYSDSMPDSEAGGEPGWDPAHPETWPTDRATTGNGVQLKDHLNAIGARDLSFGQAANLGVELVHHYDSDDNQVFHTAGGDAVYFDATRDTWDVVNDGRNGVAVKSGQMDRTHTAYISPYSKVAATAVIDETATIERGARVGPHATVGKHAHVGADSTVASYARIEAGAFIGAFSSVKDGSRIGPGAVVGTGSRIGPTTNIGAGARIEQRSEIAAFDNIAAGSRVSSTPTQTKSSGNAMRPGQITQLVDRLAALDREG